MGRQRWWGLVGILYLQGTPLYGDEGTDRVRARFTHLTETIVHFEVGSPDPTGGGHIPFSPLIAKTVFHGVSAEASRIAITLDSSRACLVAEDRVTASKLTTICPLLQSSRLAGITLTPEATRNLYGLGQEHLPPAATGADWMGKVRSSGGAFGNNMTGFNGGANGNTQIPVLYAMGEGPRGYALFLDHNYRQRWDFSARPWKVEADGGVIRGFIIAGDSIAQWRKGFLELVGKPLVPPKKMFGLWLSEYGFRNWKEAEEKLEGLRVHRFPIDGLVLDLFWFGGVKEKSDESPMGGLNWDLKNFPNPEGKIRELEDIHGVGIMPIEESYVSRNLPEHRALEAKGYLAHDGKGAASYLTKNPWWGTGGMIDWTNYEGADFWHEWKRNPLIRAGISGHWIDLGEPEMYDENSHYAGGSHRDIHNLFNFRWIESIHRGYSRHFPERRPFMLSRSGAAGVQRYGASLWSGDVGSDLQNLRSHFRAQVHMSLSGIDYYGCDIGGFHRGALKGDLDEMYTQWFAHSAMFDVPVRPHTENLCQCKQTSPALIGDLPSNRDNLRLRYSLIPYLYSLAHQAHRDGEPVFPPPFYHFPQDMSLRHIANQKMIGSQLMVAAVAGHGQMRVDVYLPGVRWYDYHSGELHPGSGQTIKGIPLHPNGNFRLPVFARAGAIIPRMRVDEATMNAAGRRLDGQTRDELAVRVFLAEAHSIFTFYEDDGLSTDYLKGKVRLTQISQGGGEINIAGATGDYKLEESRQHVIEVVGSGNVGQVLLQGAPLEKVASADAWEKAERGWTRGTDGMLHIKLGRLPVATAKNIRLE